MKKEEVELLPAGLVTCFVNNLEARILKISPFEFSIRLSEEIEDIQELKIMFYRFNQNKYLEINVDDYKVIDKKCNEFFIVYKLYINNQAYSLNIKKAFNDYAKYIRNRAIGDDNSFSREMIKYPAEKDYDFIKYYSVQKKQWIHDSNFSKDISYAFELAVNLDNDNLYEMYLNNSIQNFKEQYLKKNYIEEHKIANKNISRIYIGNEVCHNLFPSNTKLFKLMNKANLEGIDITICFTYIRECYIAKTKTIIDNIYKWCIDNNKQIEIVINDWGIIELLEDKSDYINRSLGILLNKRKKDPRYIYKKDLLNNKDKIAKNSLNSEIFIKFLKKNNITRFEYESCGYIIDTAEGKHSMHMPFYVTNTSQYCTLYAMCNTMNRGNQKLVKECPKYCREYVFSYADHLKMVGRYNSIFAYDDTLLKDINKFNYYLNNGIDRIVLNFI